jgi:mevalonate kinase
MLYAALKDLNRKPASLSWQEPWTLYQELLAEESIVPSGADLVAQWVGGIICFHPFERKVVDLSKDFDWSNLLVFSATSQADRKTPTHEHLSTLNHHEFTDPQSELARAFGAILKEGFLAIGQNNPLSFGRSMDAYAELLNHHGLEAKAATQDREILKKQKAVAGVKGAGALQSDVMLVLLKPEAPAADRLQLIAQARALKLNLVSDGLNNQIGIEWKSCLD